jgi:hypothetical protein
VRDFVHAWVKVMNADRFDLVANTAQDTATEQESELART